MKAVGLLIFDTGGTVQIVSYREEEALQMQKEEIGVWECRAGCLERSWSAKEQIDSNWYDGVGIAATHLMPQS
jgi:hypothetical protein